MNTGSSYDLLTSQFKVATKRHPSSRKNAAESCRFAGACMNLIYDQHRKVRPTLKGWYVATKKLKMALARETVVLLLQETYLFLQIQHGQLVGFHFLITFLNQVKVSIVKLRVESVPKFQFLNKIQTGYYCKHYESVE